MTAYELRISDWSSDVCSSDLVLRRRFQRIAGHSGFCLNGHRQERAYCGARLHLFPEASQRPYENSRQEPEVKASTDIDRKRAPNVGRRSEEHTSELQSLMRISYAVFCLKKKKTNGDGNKYYNHYTNKKPTQLTIKTNTI